METSEKARDDHPNPNLSIVFCHNPGTRLTPQTAQKTIAPQKPPTGGSSASLPSRFREDIPSSSPNSSPTAPSPTLTARRVPPYPMGGEVKSSAASEGSAHSHASGKGKRRSFFNIFGSRSSSHQRSRRSSASSEQNHLNDVEEDDTSDDDRSIDLSSYQAAVAPLCFKPFKATKKHLDATADMSERLQLMLDDEDYEKYLRQPKHIRTFRKSHKTAPILKRLFLAQELKQDISTLSPSDTLNQMIDGVRLNDPDVKTETANSGTVNGTMNGNSSTRLADLPNSTREQHDAPTEKKNSVWAMKFSLDGKYLASAGKGNVIRIWKVISSPLDRHEFNSADSHADLSLNGGDDGDVSTHVDPEDKTMAYASVFQEQPYRSWHGHTHDILSLDWSKNNFLLSSSMDKTVRLWNAQQTKCLRTFVHRDFVPSVKFHPTDDRFFVSGCLDHKVRLWSILEGDAKYEFDAGNLVTAVAFTPNGSITIAGTFSGMVYFLDTQTLDLRHSLEINKKKNENMKITGIECFVDGDDIKVLISSNDSRIRIISLRHKQMEYYFKGLDNNSSQIIATVSDDNKYIISGSENHWLYIWEVHKESERSSMKKNTTYSQSNNGLLDLISNKKKKRGDYTSFHAHHHVITCALIAPSGTFKALSLSNDYIYELNSELNEVGMFDEGEGARRSGSLIDNDSIGGIIVTADDHGLIRVFRQDLLSSVRKTLLKEKKLRDSHQDAGSATLHDQSHRGSLLNKAFNGSNNSLLSRGNSMRSLSGTPRNGLGVVSPDRTPQQGRSRSGTLESVTQRLNQSKPQPGQKKLSCDVCGGDKFVVSKAGTGLEVSCTDCGNQMRP